MKMTKANRTRFKLKVKQNRKKINDNDKNEKDDFPSEIIL